MKNNTFYKFVIALIASVCMGTAMADCQELPSHSELQLALNSVVGAGNSGLANDMWATLVDKDGRVCAVAFSGANRSGQWLGSRVISAQKANTANAFSLPAGSNGLVPGLALSTANLWAAVQPGGSLFGLQHSNPVDTATAYGNSSHSGGSGRRYGQHNDPMVGHFIGGVNVFGGGLALYNAYGDRVGGLGLSGDTSCSDHIQAWKVQDALELDNVPAGVAAGTDNIIFDISDDMGGNPESTSGFGHPTCGVADTDEETIAADLPITHPIGPNP